MSGGGGGKSSLQVSPVKKIRLGGRHIEDESARAAAQLLATDDLATVTGDDLGGESNEEGGGGDLISSLAPSPACLFSGGGSSVGPSLIPLLRQSSLAIFFRHMYQLAAGRMRGIADRLGIPPDLLSKSWTAFEHVLIHDANVLLKDRCLDQIMLCAIYAISKVTLDRPLSFVELVQVGYCCFLYLNFTQVSISSIKYFVRNGEVKIVFLLLRPTECNPKPHVTPTAVF